MTRKQRNWLLIVIGKPEYNTCWDKRSKSCHYIQHKKQLPKGWNIDILRMNMKYRYEGVWNDNTFTICNKYKICNAFSYKITQLWDKSTILRHNTKLEWFINRFDLVSAAGSFFIYFREFHCTLVVEYWRRHFPPTK